jgi:hypothetical protein
MLFCGIDPGTQGALCLLDPWDKTCEFIDTPNSKNLWQSLQDIDSWFRINTPHHIAIEDVHSMGGMSAKSNFQFGRNLGLVEAVTYLSDCENDIEYVQPKVWQKACGIKFPKGSSSRERKEITALIAGTLYPNAELYGPKGGLKDGRADALMIAHYLYLKYGEKYDS